MKHNLLYHIAPIPGTNYKWNIQQLVRRFHIFNGIRLIAIAEDKGFDSFDSVCDMFPTKGDKTATIFLSLSNNKKNREAESFPLLMDTLEKLVEPKPSITFYGHTKGTTRKFNAAVRLWTKKLYEFNLDRIDEVEKKLSEDFKCAGAFKRYGKFANMNPNSSWHYSGTFFWFRQDNVFSLMWKQLFKQHRYGVEELLGLLFNSEEAYCIAGDGVGSPYNLESLKKIIEEEK